MSCKPTYKGKRYNSLEELYKANGVNIQQAQQLYGSYLQTTNNPTVEGFKQWNSRQQQVSELFESNPELANAIYEAAGINQVATKEITNDFIEENLKAKGYQSAAQAWYILELPKYLDNNLIDAQSVDYAKILLNLIENNNLTKNDGYQLSDEFSKILNKAIPYLNDITKRVVGIESKLIVNGNLKNLGSNKEIKTLEFFEHINTKSFIEIRNIIKKFAEYTLNPQFSISKQDKEKTIKLINNFIKKYGNNSQITPQQKQQAQQLYSQYLDTIFPNSKVKDIVYHGSNQKINQFEVRKEPLIHFGSKNAALQRGDVLSQVVLNIKDLQTIKDGMWFLGTDEGGLLKELLDKNILTIEEVRSINEAKNKAIQESSYFHENYRMALPEGEKAGSKKLQEILKDKNIGFEYINFSEDRGSTSYAVPSQEQIHILGSKQDIEGFKTFVESNNTKTNNSESTESEIKSIVNTENKTIKNNYEIFKEVQDFFDSNLSTMDNVYNAIFNNSEITPDDIIKQIIKTDNVEKECNGGVSDSNWEIV